ncbi:hypothetical protein KM043_007315 [Ampulex compressa]|nr:hypothetical protein KM043_007315 [Ampulex compressa]
MVAMVAAEQTGFSSGAPNDEEDEDTDDEDEDKDDEEDVRFAARGSSRALDRARIRGPHPRVERGRPEERASGHRKKVLEARSSLEPPRPKSTLRGEAGRVCPARRHESSPRRNDIPRGEGRGRGENKRVDRPTSPRGTSSNGNARTIGSQRSEGAKARQLAGAIGDEEKMGTACRGAGRVEGGATETSTPVSRWASGSSGKERVREGEGLGRSSLEAGGDWNERPRRPEGPFCLKFRPVQNGPTAIPDERFGRSSRQNLAAKRRRNRWAVKRLVTEPVPSEDRIVDLPVDQTFDEGSGKSGYCCA